MTDHRGPEMLIVDAVLTPEHWVLKLACGHTQRGASHFAIHVGERFHCLECKWQNEWQGR